MFCIIPQMSSLISLLTLIPVFCWNHFCMIGEAWTSQCLLYTSPMGNISRHTSRITAQGLCSHSHTFSHTHHCSLMQALLCPLCCTIVYPVVPSTDFKSQEACYFFQISTCQKTMITPCYQLFNAHRCSQVVCGTRVWPTWCLNVQVSALLYRLIKFSATPNSEI